LRTPRRKAGASAAPPSSRALAQLLEKRLAFTVREVAALLGISSAAVRLMIAKGELPGRKIGGGTERVTYIVPTGALLSWLRGSDPGVTEGAA